MDDLGFGRAGGLGAGLRHAVEGDELVAREVVDLLEHLGVADAHHHEVRKVLAMPQLRDERAAVWDADGPAAGHAVEEEALDRVVVQGTVDVDGPDGCPIQALRVQINLASQLLLVPGVRVAWVHLGERQHARGAVDSGTAHEDELLAAARGHDRLDQRLDFLEFAGIVVVDDVELAAGTGDGGLDGCRVLAVGLEHSDAL
mmetsp:Transcript_63411/g.178975  ORF Transcript_63411/g.178975 Transcript_63411/m.178975 type:complete len:201 (+) Transcript_63411:469-1071(+)